MHRQLRERVIAMVCSALLSWRSAPGLSRVSDDRAAAGVRPRLGATAASLQQRPGGDHEMMARAALTSQCPAWRADQRSQAANPVRYRCPVCGQASDMKKLLEILVCFLHPIAVVLAWLNLAGRQDVQRGAKIAWAVFLILPLVPFLYVLTGGDLW